LEVLAFLYLIPVAVALPLLVRAAVALPLLERVIGATNPKTCVVIPLVAELGLI
jgi:hypothetical protein